MISRLNDGSISMKKCIDQFHISSSSVPSALFLGEEKEGFGDSASCVF